MRILTTLLLLLIALNAGDIESFAQKMSYETDYKVAVAKAKKEHKALLLVMVTHYCPWCRKFEKKTLSNTTINALIQKHFVPLILNREKHEFPKKFDTPRIPTSYFIDPFQESISLTSMGYQNVSDFTQTLTKAIARQKGDQ